MPRAACAAAALRLPHVPALLHRLTLFNVGCRWRIIRVRGLTFVYAAANVVDGI
jgi:hypothetical protein